MIAEESPTQASSNTVYYGIADLSSSPGTPKVKYYEITEFSYGKYGAFST